MLTAQTDRTVQPEPVEGPATAELVLEGMHCSACATRIERALATQPAVLSASVNLATHRAFVTFDPATGTPDDLCAAVDAVGYGAVALRPEEDQPEDAAGERWLLRAALSWPAALAALL